MSMLMEGEIKRWTARRKSALVLEIIQGKTTVAEPAELTICQPSEIEKWLEDGKRGMENVLRANPQDLREQYEKQLKDLQEGLRRGDAGDLRSKTIAVPAGRGREMDRDNPTGTQRRRLRRFDQSAVPLVRNSSSHCVYYEPTKKQPTVQERFAAPIKQRIEEHPSFDYRTVAYLLKFNKHTVQRIFQLMHWQVRKRPVGFRPRVRVLPPVARTPNERWATDLCRVWSGRDG